MRRNGRGPRAGRAERLGWALAVAAPLVFLGLFFAWPVATLIGRGLAPDGALDPSGFAEVLARPRTWRIIRATLVQAGLATMICVAAGVPGAHVLYRRRFPGRDLLRGLVLVPFVLPSVVVGVAFHALVTTGGPLGGGVLGRSLDGTTAIVVAALVFFNYGLVVRTVGTMWSRLDPRAVEAARALGAGPWRAWRSVTLPSLAPAIASAASLTFLFCATAYGVVLVLGGPGIGTIETEIYVLTAQYLDLRAAAVLSVLQLAVIAAALWVSERARAASQAALRLRLDVPAPRLRAGDLPALALTLAVALGLLVGPVAVLVARSLRRAGRWTLANYADLGTTGGRNALLVTVWEAAGNSLRVAVVAAGLALVIGTAVSLVVSRRPRSRRLRWGVAALDSAFMLPLGVSAVTVGFGFLITLARPPLALTRSWWILPLAQAVVAVPLVVRTLLPALRAIDPRQREAAAALGAGPGRVLATVDGPPPDHRGRRGPAARGRPGGGVRPGHEPGGVRGDLLPGPTPHPHAAGGPLPAHRLPRGPEPGDGPGRQRRPGGGDGRPHAGVRMGPDRPPAPSEKGLPCLNPSWTIPVPGPPPRPTPGPPPRTAPRLLSSGPPPHPTPFPSPTLPDRAGCGWRA